MKGIIKLILFIVFFDIVFILLTLFLSIYDTKNIVEYLSGMLGFMFLFNFIWYNIYIVNFPLNDYSEYKFDIKKDWSVKDSGEYFGVVEKREKKYFIFLNKKELVLDLRCCFIPKTVIKAYIIRQFQFEMMNKYSYSKRYLFKRAYLNEAFPKYKYVNLYFKNRKISIVKNYKTNNHLLVKLINGLLFNVTLEKNMFSPVEKRNNKLRWEEKRFIQFKTKK